MHCVQYVHIMNCVQILSISYLLLANSSLISFLSLILSIIMEEQELREYLECPVCTLIPYKTKILSCLNGHQLCQACFDKMTDVPKKCPQGSCKYNSPPTRFRMVETMISKANINLNCQNAGQGCQVEEK